MDDEAPVSTARLKVQRMNWSKLAGNELLKIQSKIQAERQRAIKGNSGLNSFVALILKKISNLQ